MLCKSAVTLLLYKGSLQFLCSVPLKRHIPERLILISILKPSQIITRHILTTLRNAMRKLFINSY